MKDQITLHATWLIKAPLLEVFAIMTDFEKWPLYFPKVAESLQVIRREGNTVELRAVAPDATERTDYFEIPGYSYDGYDYDGMFAWFSFKMPYVRLHVRPPVLQNHAEELSGYPQTKAIVSFAVDKKIPKMLVKKLVKESIQVMKSKS